MKTTIIGLLVLIACFLLTCSDSTEPVNYFDTDMIVSVNPESGSYDIFSSFPFSITFADNISIGSGSIRLYKKSDNKLVEKLDVKINATAIKTAVYFNFKNDFEKNTNYYILIDKGAFIMNSSKFAGINDKTFWEFSTISFANIESILSTTITIGSKIQEFKIYNPSISENENNIMSINEGKSYYPPELIGKDTLKLYTKINFVFNSNLEFNTNIGLDPNLHSEINIFSESFYVNNKELKINYKLQSGLIKIIYKHKKYIEGEFSFKAKTDDGKSVEVKNGYFFVKRE